MAFTDDSQITQPIQKAVTSLGLTAGAGVMAIADKAQQFLPDSAFGWVTLATAVVALIYNTLMLTEFIWKKWVRPLLRHFGILKPGSFFLETDRDTR